MVGRHRARACACWSASPTATRPGEARKLAERIWHLRIMDDDDGVMNRSVADTTGEVLVVSQFTLYGDTSRGRRPSWIAAARPSRPSRWWRRWSTSYAGSAPTWPPAGSAPRWPSSWSTTVRSPSRWSV